MLGHARGSFSDLIHVSTKCFETPQEQLISPFSFRHNTHHLTCLKAHPWLTLAEKIPIDSDCLGIDGCLRGWEVPEEASQTCPMYPPSVLKHLNSNGCPQFSCNTPFAMPRGAHLAGSGQRMSQLVPAIWVWGDALDDERHLRKLLRPIPCIHQVF